MPSSTEACNFGYARGRCDRFPVDSIADAVRFTHIDGELFYILERNYSPVEHARADVLVDAVLMAQARAFIDNFPTKLRPEQLDLLQVSESGVQGEPNSQIEVR